MRYERSVTIYADAPIIKRFQANETSISIAQGKISALISESEWIELQNSSKTMYSQLASAVLELDALTLNFSDMTAKYNGLSDQFTDLDSKVAEYKIGIDGISSNLTSVQQSLQNNYSTTIETNAAIKASIDELSSLISKDYVTNSEFGSLTIGSVNMLRNSDFAQQSRYWTAQGITVQYGSDTTVGTYARISSTAAGSTDHRLYQTTESFSHESNVEYTLSFWAKASVNTDIKAGHINQLSTFGIGTDWKRYNATYKVGSTGSFTVYPISSNVTLYITKIKIEKGSKLTDWTPAPADINELIGIEGDSAVSESNKYTNNKLTAYSTTSQVNSAINQKADEITTSVSATYATKASVTDVKEEAINSANSNTANLLKSYSTTAQMNSAISQKANEITTSVSETYATKTSVTTAKNEAITAAQGYADDAEEAANSHTDNLLKSYSTTTQMNSAISQKADEITATVAKTYMTQADFNNMKLGGRNLIRNSTGLLGTLNWENRFLDYSLLTKDGDALLRKSGQLLIFKRNISGSAATISAVTNNSYPTQQHSAFSLGNTTTGEKYVYSARFSLKASTTYTMSGYVYVSAGAKGIDILVLGDYSITDLNSQYVTYDKAYSILTYTTTGQWYYFTKTFTTDASTKSGIVRVDHNGVSSSGSTAKILFGNLKLEESNGKTTDWTPAPEDNADNAAAYTDAKLQNYSTTQQVNSMISQKADEITLSVSENYATKASVTTAEQNAVNAANANTRDLLTNYSTTTQMNSAINQKADEISTSVSTTYATKTSVTTAQNNAINTAKNYTDSANADTLETAQNYTDTAKTDTLKTAQDYANTAKSDAMKAAQGYADNAEAAANANTANLLKSYSTTTQMNSAINQKADEISTSVSETYLTQATFNEMKLGTRNLIRNSTGLLGVQGWTNNFKDYTLVTKQNKTLLRKGGQALLFKKNTASSLATLAATGNAGYPTFQQTALQLSNSTTGEKYIYSSRFALKPSTTYTMSGYVYVSSGAKGVDVFVLASNSITDLSSQYVTYDNAYSILTCTTTNQWYYFKKTFTTGASVKSGIVRIDHNGVNTAGTFAPIRYGNLKLEESNDKVTDWTPAPEDDTDYTDGKLKAYSTTVEMQSAINQKANEISMTVSQTYTTVKEFDDYKNTADVQYTTISSKYTQLADKFTWVVSGGTSSSNFTITSRLAELVANDINLHGRVTFSGLDSSAQGKINTAQSTANSAQSTANSIQNTINSNKSKWDNAASWTSSNGSNMTNLRNMVLKWTDNAVSTTTQINGGWIKTNTITADKIAANAIVSSKIAAGAITADKINVSSLESISARIGGWTISGNNLMDDKTNFMVRIAAPTEYGGDGNGNADVLVVKDKTNGTFPLVISSNGQVLATRCKFEGGTIGGWKITGTEIYCDAGSNSCGIAKYGTSLAFWAGATYANRNGAKFRVAHNGETIIDEYLHYSPSGWSTPDGIVNFSVGGWQIKKGSWDGYPTAIYWDTEGTQKNGIATDGPWVIWGGWNGGPSVNTDNYKFVVTAEGVCKAMSWVTGSRLEWKENIEQYNHSALAEVMKSDVYYYDLKNASKTWKQNRHIGFVIGDGYSVSEEILNGDKGAIDMYSALAIAYKAIQEQQQEIEMLKNKLQQS